MYTNFVYENEKEDDAIGGSDCRTALARTAIDLEKAQQSSMYSMSGNKRQRKSAVDKDLDYIEGESEDLTRLRLELGIAATNIWEEDEVRVASRPSRLMPAAPLLDTRGTPSGFIY